MADQSDWMPIATAPKDGTVVRLRRMYRRSVIAEDDGVWATFHRDARSLQRPEPDPLGRADVDAILNVVHDESEDWRTRPHWLTADRMCLFPEPTHWMARKVAR